MIQSLVVAIVAVVLGVVPSRRHTSPAYRSLSQIYTVNRANHDVTGALCQFSPGLRSFCPPRPAPVLHRPRLGPDTTLQVGTWRGAPLKVSIRLDPGDVLDRISLTATSRGQVVDWIELDGSRLLGPIWDFCGADELPDFDGDGFGEIGVPMGMGGGPYSVNVSVGVVRFDPAEGTLVGWGSDLMTPEARGRHELVEHYRGWGMGRAWTRTHYVLPSDSLVETRSVNHSWIEGRSLAENRMVWTRTESRPGHQDRVRVVCEGDLEDDEAEWFGCL